MMTASFSNLFDSSWRRACISYFIDSTSYHSQYFKKQHKLTNNLFQIFHMFFHIYLIIYLQNITSTKKLTIGLFFKLEIIRYNSLIKVNACANLTKCTMDCPFLICTVQFLLPLRYFLTFIWRKNSWGNLLLSCCNIQGNMRKITNFYRQYINSTRISNDKCWLALYDKLVIQEQLMFFFFFSYAID